VALHALRTRRVRADAPRVPCAGLDVDEVEDGRVTRLEGTQRVMRRFGA